MIVKVTEQGLLVPKDLWWGLDEVEILGERNFIVVSAPGADPIFGLGQQPLTADENDASINHDDYLHC